MPAVVKDVDLTNKQGGREKAYHSPNHSPTTAQIIGIGCLDPRTKARARALMNTSMHARTHIHTYLRMHTCTRTLTLHRARNAMALIVDLHRRLLGK